MVIGEDVQLGSLPVTPMLTLSDRLPLANAGRSLARPPSLMFSGSRSCTLLSCSWGYLHQRPWQPTCRDSSLSERKQPIFPCRHDVGSRMDAWHRDQLLTASSVKHKVASRQLSTAGRLRVIRDTDRQSFFIHSSNNATPYTSTRNTSSNRHTPIQMPIFHCLFFQLKLFRLIQA